MKYYYIILFLLSIIIAAFSQILLKKGSKKKNIYFNFYTISGYSIMIISTLLTLVSYKYINLSLGQILQALSFVFVAILCNVFLKEKISCQKLFGIALIVFGIIIFNV